MLTFSLPSKKESAKVGSKKILSFLKDFQIDKKLLFNIRLCCEEAIINAVKHGNQSKESLSVEVALKKEKDRIQISVKDQGPGFNFAAIPNPTSEDNLVKLSGRGIYLIRQLMDEVNYADGGSRITMIKNLEKKQ
ncbi:ATP-binding protein [Candidatus Omnitrophota bacterium]